MDEEGLQPEQREEEQEDVPFGQIVFDNVFLWFLLGIAVPALFYLLWGLLDIASTPMFVPGE